MVSLSSFGTTTRVKILLLGRDGQVGRELSRSLLPLGQLTALGRIELNLANSDAILNILNALKPDLIVNAAAYTSVDKAETDKTAAFQINADSVKLMADFAKHNNAIFIHYSTDYVFDGCKKEAYLETDSTNPLNIYGASKLAGEQAILKSGCRGYIFRTSWVFSPHGNNFIKTILNLAKARETLSIVTDQQGSPTSAELISDVTLLAISAALQDKLTPGIYHLSAGGVTTWFYLAQYIIDKSIEKEVDLKLVSSKIQPILSKAYPLPAKRPKNSQLDSSCLSSMLNITMPEWTIYVDRMISQLILMRFFE